MLAPWKKSYDQLDSILKSRAITLPTMVCLVKAMVFPVVMYGCESWTIKKTEQRRTDSLEKTLMLGKMEGRRRRGRQMVGWHHWLNGHEFEQVLGIGDGRGGLVCCSPWAHKELDMTEQLNWTELTGNCFTHLWLPDPEKYWTGIDGDAPSG